MWNHGTLERNSIILIVCILLTVAVGGLVEIAPLFYLENTIEKVQGMRPYSPLELAGRNIYIREGCYACHSQMIRTLQDDVDRYGHYSLAVESKYDHPMLWGSKRTGPDLARVGGKYSDAWQVAHLTNPRSVVPQSVMPKYSWLNTTELQTTYLGEHLKAQRDVGVPYTDAMIANAPADAVAQASPDGDTQGLMKRYGPATQVRSFDGDKRTVSEMDALVAYLQVLGKLSNAAQAPEPAGK